MSSEGGCIEVPGPIAEAIRAGLVSGVRLTGLRAVRSNAFERVWMVSGRLSGPGVADNETATWATNQFRDENHHGLILSVDAAAKRFSDYGDGGGRFSVSDHGVAESKACALAARSE